MALPIFSTLSLKSYIFCCLRYYACHLLLVFILCCACYQDRHNNVMSNRKLNSLTVLAHSALCFDVVSSIFSSPCYSCTTFSCVIIIYNETTAAAAKNISLHAAAQSTGNIYLCPFSKHTSIKSKEKWRQHQTFGDAHFTP